MRIVRFAYARHFLSGCETYIIAPTALYYVKSLGQNELFLAFVLSAYNISAIIAGPIVGRITDRIGHPRELFLATQMMKIVAYVLYSVNASAYFPLVGRFLAGLSDGGLAIVFGQVALQSEIEARGPIYVFLEGIYCLGATVGPAIGSFITFKVNILGWHINEGNSPGIVLAFVWTLFFIASVLQPKDMWVLRNDDKTLIQHDSDDQKVTEDHPDGDRSLTEYGDSEDVEKSDKNRHIEDDPKIELNSPVLCLFYLIFCNEVLSSTSTFYVPILALNHFHLQLIHVKLLFLDCTAFTLFIFILFHLASGYFDERKLFVVSLGMQIAAISLLTSIGFAWNHITTTQNYILLVYICLGMPYFAFPFSNSILSKITDPRNASYYQGSSYAALHSAIVISRVIISFIVTKESLIAYCFVLAFFWLVGFIWFAIHYKQFVATEEQTEN